MRDYVDEARTIAWFYVVARASKLHLRELDRQFGTGTSGAWSKYRYGRLSPSSERINAVERVYPGTQRYFEAPLWRLIRPELLGGISPRRAFEWLLPPLRDRFMVRGAAEEDVFWRKPSDLGRDLSHLLAEAEKPGKSLDVATALAALFHEAVLMQDKMQFATCFNAWVLYSEARQEHEVMMYVPDRCFDTFLNYILDHAFGDVLGLHSLPPESTKFIARLRPDCR